MEQKWNFTGTKTVLQWKCNGLYKPPYICGVGGYARLILDYTARHSTIDYVRIIRDFHDLVSRGAVYFLSSRACPSHIL